MTIDISKYSDLDLALMVLLNYFGTGTTRKKKLGDRYKAVQTLVNAIGSGRMPLPEEPDVSAIRKALEEAMPTKAEMDEFVDDIMKGA